MPELSSDYLQQLKDNFELYKDGNRRLIVIAWKLKEIQVEGQLRRYFEIKFENQLGYLESIGQNRAISYFILGHVGILPYLGTLDRVWNGKREVKQVPIT